ncbi:MAG: pyridoxal 5'-phosphate synthase glutaminase subunit PdxT [Thermaerobacter sp.]|nr:pyridoxal 5'-phosphate synthase glutaminase subunit PdxT [Thermaerobacter sp.]
MTRIGIAAVQGAVREHERVLSALGAKTSLVRRSEDLAGLDGLILPGGESTTIGMLFEEYGISDVLRRGEIPVFGTCAGMILLAKEIEGSEQPRLGLMDIAVRRNAFGRQRESFEEEIAVPAISTDEPIRGVFIRAPYVTSTGAGVEVLGTLDGKIVLCRQGRMLAGSFHPELTDDLRLHRYFLEEVVGQGA